MTKSTPGPGITISTSEASANAAICSPETTPPTLRLKTSVAAQNSDRPRRDVRRRAVRGRGGGNYPRPRRAPRTGRAHLRDLEVRYASLPGRDAEELARLERQITDVSLRYGVLCRLLAARDQVPDEEAIRVLTEFTQPQAGHRRADDRNEFWKRHRYPAERGRPRDRLPARMTGL
jgi:hypothetical protein